MVIIKNCAFVFIIDLRFPTQQSEQQDQVIKWHFSLQDRSAVSFSKCIPLPSQQLFSRVEDLLDDT